VLYRWSKTFVLIAVLAMVTAACGGSDDDTQATTESPATSEAPMDDGDEPMDDEPMDDGEEMPATTTAGGGESPMASGATVTVGDEEFSLESETVCVTMGGAIGAQFDSADGLVTFNVDLPPESWDGTTDDWSPASVRLDDERDDMDYRSWRAGDDVLSAMDGVPPEVTVTAFSIDGSTATGTATVVDINSMMVGDPVMAEMTFSIACG